MGWRNNSVFPGVAEMLAQLHQDGFPLYVCTSKHEHFAVRILERFGIARYFDGIYGDKIEYASHSKIDLLARILSEHAIDRETAWMVGDRSFDIEAAHANDIRCMAAGGATARRRNGPRPTPLRPRRDVFGIIVRSAVRRRQRDRS